MKLPDFGEAAIDYCQHTHNRPFDPAYNPGRLSKGYPTAVKAQDKVEKVMHEFKEGTLHSGKHGPVVTDRKQAIAIALSEQQRAKKK